MYKVILVDSEMSAIESFKAMIKWSAYGFNIQGSFVDAKSALKHISQRHIDVIFTDIEIPDMNGLDFIAEAKRLLPNVKVVILSKSDNFSYARRAISLRVFEYCLKPVTKSTADELMKRLKIELDKDSGRYSEFKVSYGINNAKFKKLVEYINENYQEKFYLKELADMFGLNITFCCQLFNKYMGCTFMDYCAKLKMEKAAELILQNEMSILEIAEYLNYDYFYFNKLFKKHYGMTPKRYKDSMSPA